MNKLYGNRIKNVALFARIKKINFLHTYLDHQKDKQICIKSQMCLTHTRKQSWP